jgi:type II secretory pathway component PulF
MAVFEYSATGPASLPCRGTIVADSPRGARDLLRQRGLRVRTLSPHDQRPPRGLRLGRANRFDHKTVAFIRELATLLGVGVPMLEAIDAISRQHHGKPFQAVLLRLRDRIAAGASLTEAMKRQPEVFDAFCVNLTEVGESAGTLDTVLDRLAEFKERTAQMKDRVTTALLYPCVVMSMAVAVSLFLMTFVVPNLLDGLIESGQEIPRITRVVKFLSDLLISRWWALLLAALAAAAAGGAALRTGRGRLLWHRVLLKIPVVGEMVRKQAILRIAVVMSTLIRNGVIFGRAIQIAQQSTDNLVIRDALRWCETAINGGQDIAGAMESTGVFPPVVVRIFSVGQQSGRLEEMLDRLAAAYEQQLATSSQRLTAVLEPVLILFLVVVVGFIALATVLPMLEAANVF